jgi:hypothetical protein
MRAALGRLGRRAFLNLALASNCRAGIHGRGIWTREVGSSSVTNISIDARGATPGMEQKLLDAAEVLAQKVYDRNAPGTISTTIKIVRAQRRAQGVT